MQPTHNYTNSIQRLEFQAEILEVADLRLHDAINDARSTNNHQRLSELQDEHLSLQVRMLTIAHRRIHIAMRQAAATGNLLQFTLLVAGHNDIVNMLDLLQTSSDSVLSSSYSDLDSGYDSDSTSRSSASVIVDDSSDLSESNSFARRASTTSLHGLWGSASNSGYSSLRSSDEFVDIPLDKSTDRSPPAPANTPIPRY